jgi:hypothetical protein
VSPPQTSVSKARKGLTAPKWSDAAQKFPGDRAWAIDEKKVGEGRNLYRKHCFECHRGPVADPQFDEKYPDYSFWRESNPDRSEKNWVTIKDHRYFNVVQKRVADIGTDRQQSRVLTERQVKLPPELRLKPVEYMNAKWGCDLPRDDPMNSSFTPALMIVVDRTSSSGFRTTRLPTSFAKRCGGYAPIAKTAGFSLRSSPALEPLPNRSSSSCHTTGPGRWTECGRRPRIFTTGRCPRSITCCCRSAVARPFSALAAANSTRKWLAWSSTTSPAPPD